MCKQKVKGNGACRHCGFIGSTTMLIREHGSNCKSNPKNKEQMKAGEVAKILANRINQEHYVLHYMDKVFKAGQLYQSSQPNPHRITDWQVSKLCRMYENGTVKLSRMVEILNEIAEGKHKERIEI
jgi:hypothetical protein